MGLFKGFGFVGFEDPKCVEMVLQDTLAWIIEGILIIYHLNSQEPA